MKGGLKQASQGFTIIETMIVLAVTGLTLLVATTLISGRQWTQFATGVNQARQQVQQIISEVGNGYYPNKGTFSCTSSGSGHPTLAVGSNSQGTNEGCIFLGKVLQAGTNTDSARIVLVPLAGNRRGSDGNDVDTLAKAQPIAIAPATAAGSVSPDATESRSFDRTLQIVSMKYVDTTGATNSAGAVGFVSQMATYDATTSLMNSAALQVNMYAIKGTDINKETYKTAQQINVINAVNFVATNSVSICLASTTTNQSGLLAIGGNGADLSVTLTVKRG